MSYLLRRARQLHHRAVDPDTSSSEGGDKVHLPDWRNSCNILGSTAYAKVLEMTPQISDTGENPCVGTRLCVVVTRRGSSAL